VILDVTNPDHIEQAVETSPSLSFALEGESVYLTYSTGGREVELLTSYYPILDGVPRAVSRPARLRPPR
jgi:hypothetical protein